MKEEQFSLMIIEENNDWISFFLETVQKSNYLPKITKVQIFHTVDSAVKWLSTERVDLIVLNLFLSDSQGLDSFLKVYALSLDAPIIVTIDEGYETLAFDAVSLGAQEFITHKEKSSQLLAHIIRTALERNSIRQSHKELIFLDELTSVYNRRGFVTLGEQQLEISKRLKKGCYLFLVDVDRLKFINDNFGHAMGDLALIQTAHILKNSFRSSDVVGRIGGDEFAVMAIGDGEKYESDLLHNLYKNLDQLNLDMASKSPYQLSFSVGKTFCSPHSEKRALAHLLEEADKSLYQAKKVLL